MSATDHIDQAVLSDRFQREMVGQRLVTALFTTFSFDPGFFEQEVLRVFFDLPLTHSRELRLVQLDDALRELPIRPAVYYDARALTDSGVGSARLDIARHPVRMAACFHPKLVCALTEATEPNEEGYRPRRLIVACLSANLTRAGWWENVEACHIEVLSEKARSPFVVALRAFLVWVGEQSPTAPAGEPGVRSSQRFENKGEAVGAILGFLDDVAPFERLARDPIATRFLWTDMATRGRSITNLLDAEVGRELHGMNLEVISPFFDDANKCRPLDDLVERFEPNELQVYLPRAADGTALVSRQLFEAVRRDHGNVWSKMPGDLLRSGPAANAAPRSVHAKVYRFFRANPKREIWFVGSANLSTPAHQAGGNMECGFIVERDLQALPRPTFLTTLEDRKPTDFAAAKDPLEDATTFLTRLTLRYNWTNGEASAFWDHDEPAPRLTLRSGGVMMGEVESLAPRTWQPLKQPIAEALASRLAVSSLVTAVSDDGASGSLLVMEEGMTHKPSLLHTLSAADILRYWSMLKAEQRTIFLESRLGTLLLQSASDDLELAKTKLIASDGSIFDRFAGFFHAFHTLEKSVIEALGEGRVSHAVARLFGKKHDSLGHLLDRLESPDDPIRDDVDRYVIVLCAKQSLDSLRKRNRDFWSEHRGDADALTRRVESLCDAHRAKLQTGALNSDFLVWFEDEFLRREKIEESANAHS